MIVNIFFLLLLFILEEIHPQEPKGLNKWQMIITFCWIRVKNNSCHFTDIWMKIHNDFDSILKPPSSNGYSIMFRIRLEIQVSSFSNDL